MDRREFIGVAALYLGAALFGAIGGVTAKESGDWGESEDDEPPSRKERTMFAEYLTIDNETSRVELRELTEVMAENLSETATVVSMEFIGGKTTVWRDRVPSVVGVDGGTLLELKRRAEWRDGRNGWIS